MSQDHRLIEIQHWLKTVLPQPGFTIEPASSDASFRRYFRVKQHDQSWIVMDAPPKFEDTSDFISIGSFLYSHNINVPEICAQDTEQGFLLLTDFGNQSLLANLNDETSDRLYRDAIDSLIAIQLANKDKADLADYDRELLLNELNLFPQWFLSEHLSIDIPDFLPALFEVLISNATEQTAVVVHRDYHSRNLMVTSNDTLGIIDFQDAVIGPITYDLVSLLRDCYIAWPDDKVRSWVNYYYAKAVESGLLTHVSIDQFIRWFDFMGLQRHIKVLGIFSRLNYRDGKPNYLSDLPLTLHYVRKISSRYPELAQFNEFITHHPKLATIK